MTQSERDAETLPKSPSLSGFLALAAALVAAILVVGVFMS